MKRGKSLSDLRVERLKPGKKPLTASELLDPLRELYQQHKESRMLPTSGRFLYYELETFGFISKESVARTDGKKGRRSDQNMIDGLTKLRERGEIPWQDVVDETRSLEDYQGYYGSIREWSMEQAEYFETDIWKGAAPLILTESRSLAGVLRPIVQTYRVLVSSTNGQAHGHLVNKVSKFAKRKVLYFGDADLSGGHCEENSRRILVAPDWERLAITEGQIARYDLPIIQKYDKRDRNYHDAVETEALGQERITRILIDRLEELLPETLRDVQEQEERERQQFREQLEQLRR
jgi:hypothetical protein